MPRGVKPRFDGTKTGSDLQVVYFPSCIARTMGPERGDDESTAVYAATLSLLAKARCDVVFPSELSELCCGLSFESKGYPREGDQKRRELEAALLEASQGGALPVLFDTSPCAYRVHKGMDPRLRIYEPVEFIQRFLLDRLRITPVPGPIAVHVPCSSVKMNLAARFRDVATACAERVVMPSDVGCCGFAGDRGFSYPELPASALERLAPSIAGCESGYSTSRTCEIGLSQHGGVRYRSIAVLVDRCASALPTSALPANAQSGVVR
jgi:D-lactate dehydrogenase